MKDGGPAFPVEPRSKEGIDALGRTNSFLIYSGSYGMTLRDYFAAAALPEMMVLVRHNGPKPNMSATERTAIMAYEQADAMLAERERGR